MSYRLVFYRSERGEEPALDYIRGQPQTHRAKIGRALRNLEILGHEARRPMVDHLGGGLYELRVPADGHQHRLLYFFSGRTMILVTSAFLKNEAQVPANEIQRARRRREDWIERNEDGNE